MRLTHSSPARLLSEATAHLAAHGIPTPRLDAEVLLSHTLGITKTALYTRLHTSRDISQDMAFWQQIERRAKHEPLQYITGIQEFWSLDLLVDRRVRIPRPETELLVEVSLELLGAAASTHSAKQSPEHPIKILDLGTGSGCIAIALALVLILILIFCIFSERFVPCCNRCWKNIKNNPK